MEYSNGNTNGKTPDRKNVKKNKLDIVNGLNDGLIITDNLNPPVDSMTKENTKMAEKKIVNNRPQQYRPIIGVNFHNLRK